jgi:hypothetical protein
VGDATSSANSYSYDISDTFSTSGKKIQTGESLLMRELFTFLIAAISIACSYFSILKIAVSISLAAAGGFDATKAFQYVASGIIISGGHSIEPGPSER